MNRWLFAAALLAAGTTAGLPNVLPGLLPGPVTARAADDEPAVTEVTFTRLGDTVRSLRGKVVLVDFWADYCVPCKKNFPNLVSLSKDLGKDGLAVVSVNLDDPKDRKIRDRAVKFLRDSKATFTNLVLAESEDPLAWFERLKIDQIPAALLYDRDGGFVKKFVDPFKHEEVEAAVRRLLK